MLLHEGLLDPVLLLGQLLNNTCVTMWDTGASTRLVMDAKNSLLVNVARKDKTTEAEREKFAATAAAAQRYYRAINTEDRSGLAATQMWRPSAWTNIFFATRPAPSYHGSLAPFWQYGFENRQKRKRCDLQVCSFSTV